MWIRSSQSNACRRQAKQRGVALILVMLLMLLLSLMAATLVFTARSETFASLSYRQDTEADYVAKAGVQAAANWFRSGHYQPVSNGQASVYYDVTSDGSAWNLYSSDTSPVNCINASSSKCPGHNSPVKLISYGSGTSNYPADLTNSMSTLVSSDFRNSLKDVQVTAGPNGSGYFCVNAYLLSYVTVNCPSCAVSPAPMETWLITSQGAWGGTSCTSGVVAIAEEQATVQPIFQSRWDNALYAYCGLTMSGSAGACTDSFNSALGPYGAGNPSVASGTCDSGSTNVIDSGAGVGANGYVSLSSNVTISGDVTVGNVSQTPPPSCCTGSHCGYSGGGSVQGSVISAPPAVPPPVPTFPSGPLSFPAGPPAAPSITGSLTLPQISLTIPTVPTLPILPGLGNPYTWPCMTGLVCNGSATNPYLLNTVTLTGGSLTLTLFGGPSVSNPVYYDVDALTEAGLASIVVNGYVVLNVQSSLSITGLGVLNPLTTKPESLLISYGGTGTISFGGNGGLSAVVSAPNATVNLGGGGSKGYLVGAVQAANVNDLGGYPVHYDVQLKRLEGKLGRMIITSYSRVKQ